jgi:hypothetical protein
MVLVDEDLHHLLLVTKSMGSFRNLSDVIRHYIGEREDQPPQPHSP